MAPDHDLDVFAQDGDDVVNELDLGGDLRLEIERLEVGRRRQARSVADVSDRKQVDVGRQGVGGGERLEEAVVVRDELERVAGVKRAVSGSSSPAQARSVSTGRTCTRVALITSNPGRAGQRAPRRAAHSDGWGAPGRNTKTARRPPGGGGSRAGTKATSLGPSRQSYVVQTGLRYSGRLRNGSREDAGLRAAMAEGVMVGGQGGGGANASPPDDDPARLLLPTSLPRASLSRTS